MGSSSRRFKQWLARFKEEVRSGNHYAAAQDEWDGWLETGDFRNYFEEGLTPAEAAEQEIAVI